MLDQRKFEYLVYQIMSGYMLNKGIKATTALLMMMGLVML